MTADELRQILAQRKAERERGGGTPAPPGPSPFKTQDMDQFTRVAIQRLLKGA